MRDTLREALTTNDERPEGHRRVVGMHAQQAAPRAAAVREGDRSAGERMVQRALRRRRGRLHRRSRLHPPLRLPVAVGQAHRRSAQATIRSRRSTTAASAAAIAARSRRRRCSARPSTAPTSSTTRPAGTASSARLRARGHRLPAAPPRKPARIDFADAGSRRDRRIAPPTGVHDASGRSPSPCSAIGGQGGGVLTDWIVALAERNGWLAQSTSVPGVAQRTGATIYYIEMLPPTERPRAGPVADAGAGRRRRRDRGRADGGRPRHPARPRHAGPHDADRLDAPHLRRRREDRAGRRHRAIPSRW